MNNIITMGALLGAPIIAPLLAWLLHKQSAWVQRWALSLCLVVVVAVSGLVYAGFSTQRESVDVGILAVTYVLAGVLLVSFAWFRQKVLGYLVAGAAMLVLVVVSAFGLLGLMGLMTELQETAPRQAAYTLSDMACYAEPLVSEDQPAPGYGVEVVKTYAYLPGIERQISYQEVFDTSASPAEVCQGLMPIHTSEK